MACGARLAVPSQEQTEQAQAPEETAGTVRADAAAVGEPTPCLPTQPPAYAFQPARPKTNGMAIASMVCGICGFFFYGIPGIVGFTLGLVARKKIKSTGEGGAGFATAGIACGAVSAGLWLLFWIAIIVALVFAVANPPLLPPPDWLDEFYNAGPVLNAALRGWF